MPLEYGSTAMSVAGSITGDGSGPVQATRSVSERWPSAWSQTKISAIGVPSTAADLAASVATGRKSEMVMIQRAPLSRSWPASSAAVLSELTVVTVAPARVAP